VLIDQLGSKGELAAVWVGFGQLAPVRRITGNTLTSFSQCSRLAGTANLPHLTGCIVPHNNYPPEQSDCRCHTKPGLGVQSKVE